MHAVQLISVGHPLEDREVPAPRPGPDDLLVRVRAAGICHSDAHYRSGVSPAGPLPLTLGHEVAGTVEEAGERVEGFATGDRVCLHYLLTCGSCRHCHAGTEQFCSEARMLGKHRDGGYAELVAVPARCVFPLPEPVSFEHGAALMCSSSTALHALRKARLQPDETVAVFGVGGLGSSAIQLAVALGAGQVFGIDISAAKLDLARRLGAVPVDANAGDAAEQIRTLTDGAGVDIALELIGLPATMRQAVRCLAVMGRAALAGLTDQTIEVSPYRELLNREAEIIGVCDHLATDIPDLLRLVTSGRLDLSPIVTGTVPLAAGPINERLDALEAFAAGGDVRSVIAM